MGVRDFVNEKRKEAQATGASAPTPAQAVTPRSGGVRAFVAQQRTGVIDPPVVRESAPVMQEETAPADVLPTQPVQATSAPSAPTVGTLQDPTRADLLSEKQAAARARVQEQAAQKSAYQDKLRDSVRAYMGVGEQPASALGHMEKSKQKALTDGAEKIMAEVEMPMEEIKERAHKVGQASVAMTLAASRRDIGELERQRKVYEENLPYAKRYENLLLKGYTDAAKAGEAEYIALGGDVDVDALDKMIEQKQSIIKTELLRADRADAAKREKERKAYAEKYADALASGMSPEEAKAFLSTVDLVDMNEVVATAKEYNAAEAEVRRAKNEIYYLEGTKLLADLTPEERLLVLDFVGDKHNVPETAKKYHALEADLYKRGMTQEEVQKIYYTVEAAYNRMRAAKDAEFAAKWAIKEPISANVASVIGNVVGGGLATASVIGQALTDGDRPIDFNTPATGMSRFGSNVRDETSRQIAMNADSERGARVGTFLYGAFMSTLDSLAVGSIASATQIPLIGDVLLGSAAAYDSMTGVKEKGGTDEQAVLAGLAAGFFEGFFEHFSLGELSVLKDKPIGSLRALAWETLKSMGINASEEAATELADIFSEYFIAGGASDLAVEEKRLWKENPLASEKWIKGKLALYVAGRVGLAGFGGALQGGMMAGSVGLFNYDRNFTTAKNLFTDNGKIDAESVNALVTKGLASEKKSAQRLAEKVQAQGEQAKIQDVSQLYAELSEQQQEMTDPAEVEAAAVEAGTSPETSGLLTDAEISERAKETGLTPDTVVTVPRADGTSEQMTYAEYLQKRAQEQTAEDGKPDYLSAVELLQTNISRLSGMQNVAEISGEEIKKEGKPTERILDFIKNLKNAVTRTGFGEVLFSKSRIKNSILGHGYGNTKVELFAAVPSVIENGKQIDYRQNWKGRGYDSYVFAAPVNYLGKQVYVACIVTKGTDNRYYLHEAVDENGSLLYENKERRDVVSDRSAENPGNTVTNIVPSESSISQDGAQSQGKISEAEIAQRAKEVGLMPETVVTVPRADGTAERMTYAEHLQEQAREDDLGLSTSPSTSMKFKDASEYLPEKKSIIRGYLQSVNSDLLAFIKRVKNGEKTRPWFNFGKVGSALATDIQRITGVDVSEFLNSMAKDDVKHIVRRHGENGEHDKTMRDDNDIARIGYVLSDYDNIYLDGTTDAVTNSDQTPAKVVVIEKKINGTYYIVEAVPDSAAKKLRILSAYISVKGASHASAKTETVDSTPEASLPYNADISSVAQNAGQSQGDFSDAQTAERDAPGVQQTERKLTQQEQAVLEAMRKVGDKIRTTPQQRVYSALSGDAVTNASADAIASDAEQRAAFENLTGVQLTGNTVANRKTVKENAKRAAEAYRMRTVSAAAKLVEQAGYLSDPAAMRAAVGQSGVQAYNQYAGEGVRGYRLTGGNPVQNFHAEFGAYYNQGMRGEAFDYMGTRGLQEVEARAVYEAGQKDRAVLLATSAAEQSGLQVGASEEQIEIGGRLEKALGREIVFVDVDDPHFHGVYYKGRIYLNIRSTAPIVTTAAHEFTHSVQSKDSKAYRALRNHVFAVLTKDGTTVEALRQRKREQSAVYADKSDTDLDFEIVASFIGERVLTAESEVQALVASVGQEKSGRLHDILNSIVTKVKAAFSGSDSKAAAAEIAQIEQARKLLADVIRENKKATSEEAAFSVSDTFESEYNQWALHRKNDVRLFVGTTSDALKSIGVKEQNIYWDSSKINKSLSKHSELDDSIMKQVPYLLENPILIMESNSLDAKISNPNGNRVVLLGEVYGKDGVPVMTVLELEPTNKNGVLLDEIKVVSTYTKLHENNAITDKSKGTQNLINESRILYIDPQKNRTNAWLRRNRLQLPFGVTKFGSIGSIAYASDYVKYLFNGNEDGDIHFSYGEDAEKEPEVRKMPNGEAARKLLADVIRERKGQERAAVSEAETKNTAEGDVWYSREDIKDVPEIVSFVKEALSKSKGNEEKVIVDISSEENKAINRLAGTYGDGYRGKYTGGQHIVDADHIRHAMAHNSIMTEALRAQLPVTEDDIVATLSAIAGGKAKIVDLTYGSRGDESILQEVPVNGYTLYAEEIVRNREGKPYNLEGRTIYKTPTKTTAQVNGTSPSTSPRNLSRAPNNSIHKNVNLSTENFLLDEKGEKQALYVAMSDGSPVVNKKISGLIFLSAKKENVRAGADSIKEVNIQCRKPFYITSENRVYMSSKDNVAEKVRNLQNAGYDCFIFDYHDGDRYAVMVTNKAQIVPIADVVENGKNQTQTAVADDTEQMYPSYGEDVERQPQVETMPNGEAAPSWEEMRLAPTESALRMLKGGMRLSDIYQGTGVSLRTMALQMQATGTDPAEIRRFTGMYQDDAGVWRMDQAWIEKNVPNLEEIRQAQQQERKSRPKWINYNIWQSAMAFSPEAIGVSSEVLNDVWRSVSDGNRVVTPTKKQYAEDRHEDAVDRAVERIMKERIPTVNAVLSEGVTLLDIAKAMHGRYADITILQKTGYKMRKGKWKQDQAKMIRLINEGGKDLSVQDYLDFEAKNAKEVTEEEYDRQYKLRDAYALDKLGHKIAEPLVDIAAAGNKPSELRANAREAYQLDRWMRESYTEKASPTGAERSDAEAIVRGVKTLAELSEGSRRNVVLELVYMLQAKRALTDSGAAVQFALAKDRFRERASMEIFGSEDSGAMPTKPAKQWSLSMNTAVRNSYTVFGDTVGKRVNALFFDPVRANEANRIRFLNEQTKKVVALKLNAYESAAVQMKAENTKESLAAYMDLLQKNGQNIDVRKVDNAVKVFQELYNTYYDAINDFLVMHGYPPIGYVKNYMPHVQADSVIDALKEQLNRLGFETESVDELPAEIAGRTESYKPGKKWTPYFLKRKSERGNVQYDAVGCFDSYVSYISEVLYHTDDIQKLRILDTVLRERYSDKAAGEEISRLREERYSPDPNKKLQEIDERLSEMYSELKQNKLYGTYAVWLDEYIDRLAGKQGKGFDRAFELTFGRKALNLGQKVSNAFSGAAIVGNLSSALKQFEQVPMAAAETGGIINKYMAQAFLDLRPERLGGGKLNATMDFDAMSDFYIGKQGVEFAAKKMKKTKKDFVDRFRTVEDIASIPFETFDNYATRLIIRTKFFQLIDQNKEISADEALRQANDFTEALIGSRAKGSKPLIFMQKNIVTRAVTMFQLEALNGWEHLAKDIPRQYREYAKAHGEKRALRKVIGALLAALLNTFLFNRVAEEVIGQTPAPFDIFGILLDSLGAGWNVTGNQLIRNMIDGVSELTFGKRIFGTDKLGEFSLGSAASEAWEEVVDDIPIVGNVSAMFGLTDGKLPLPKVWDSNIGKGVSGLIAGEERAGSKLLGGIGNVAKTWIPMGSQISKTIRGGKIAFQEEQRSGGAVTFANDFSIWDTARLLAFGPTALRQYNEYWLGRPSLTKSQTEQYDALRETGAKAEESFNLVRNVVDAKATAKDADENQRDAAFAIIKNNPIGDDQKNIMYYANVATSSEKRAMDALEVQQQEEKGKVYRLMEAMRAAKVEDYPALQADRKAEIAELDKSDGDYEEDLKSIENQYLKLAQQQALDDFDVSDEAKAVAYYYMYATEKEEELYDELTERGVKPTDVYPIMAAASKAEKLRAIASSKISDADKQIALLDVAGDKSDAIADVTKAGGSLTDYIVAYASTIGVESDKDKDGKTIALSKSKNLKEAIDGALPKASRKVKEALYTVFNVSKKVW